jgi:gluconate transporter
VPERAADFIQMKGALMSGGNALILLTLGSIAVLLFLILYVRLHAFLALMLTSMGLGLASGMEPLKVLKSIQTGFGEALGFIAVVIALGAMIGRLLEDSGGGRALADDMLARFGKEHAKWAVLSSSFLVGLPIFFEVGFIILVPLAWSLARESKKSLLYFGLPIAAALTVTHAMVPPHPAPAAAAQLVGADLGKAILYGAALSIPMAIAGGIVYGTWIAKRLYIPLPEHASLPSTEKEQAPPPRVSLVALHLTLPVLLILAAAVAQFASIPGRTVLSFLGHPFVALALTALSCMYVFGFRRGLSRGDVARLMTDSLLPIGTLLAIIGGGGAFKQIIVDCGVGPYTGQMLVALNVSPLVLAYLMAAAMRIAQGSATVAIITAAGIVAPLVKNIPGYAPEMILLALCCGGTVLSHVNDAGFWLVKESFGMSVPQTLRSWTTMKVITSIVGIIIVLAVQAVISR